MKSILSAVLMGLLMNSSYAQPKPFEPVAKKIPHKMTIHNDTRVDDYFWMKDKTNPSVIEYLKANNAYTEAMMTDTKVLQESLYKEMRSRIKESDVTYPYKEKNYYYFTETLEGKEYPIYKRKKTMTAEPETLLDVNQMAEGKAFLRVPFPQIHPNEQLMAYSQDEKGDRVYDIYFKDLLTGKNLEQKLEDVTGNYVWAETGRVIFYTKANPVTLRSDKLYRYDLDTNKSELLMEEKDEKFEIGVYKSTSRKYIFGYVASTLSTEFYTLDAFQPQGKFQLFQKREKNHEFILDDGGDRFYIRSNDKAKNFKLMEAPYTARSKKEWKEVIAHRADTLLEGVNVFKNHIVLSERSKGLSQLSVYDRTNGKSEALTFPDPVYMASIGANPEYDTDKVRYEYESMTRPDSVFEYDTKTKSTQKLKEKEVPGYNSENYVSERIFVKAHDGAQIPVSILYKKGLQKNATAPMLVYGYGSYGASMDPWFSTGNVSLIDRGFVYALAHIRGGSEMGRHWYDDGKFLKKKNTFQDFISVTEELIKEKYADPKKVFAMGGSAGGLLMGAVMNMRPDLYNGIVAQVPFVDVMTTMLDSSIPFTTGEYEEWGNPNDKKYYRYMKSYSPYDNVKAAAYPHLLVTTGLNDSQVGYWEPAKWVAKLRDMRTDKSKMLLLKTEMEVGHGGKSGRFEYLRERAFEYAFIINLAK